MVDLKRTDLTVRAERAVLIQVYDSYYESLAQTSMDELRNLARTALANIVDEMTQPRPRPDPKGYLGKGKVQELAMLCHEEEADIVICDDDLKPSQVRHLEEALDIKVVDRSELILDIFAQHARTKQAKLQVELAQLEYSLPRLKKMWTHLDRQVGATGGVGIGLRGPGEKQLESDRRLVERRIFDLRKDLRKVEQQRHRTATDRSEQFRSVALVGYTNAGKSTLMNALTGAGVSVRDRLFETLDTRTREWTLADGRTVMISDTVGFIRKLPHHLVASFHATLEEARESDLLLHVADASSPSAPAQIDAVNEVLQQLGCGARPVCLVLNKMDALDDPLRLPLLRQKAEVGVSISARTGEGLDELTRRVQQFLDRCEVELTVEVSAGNGRLLALLHEKGVVLDRTYRDGVALVRVRVPPGMTGVIESLGGRAVTESSPEA